MPLSGLHSPLSIFELSRYAHGLRAARSFVNPYVPLPRLFPDKPPIIRSIGVRNLRILNARRAGMSPPSFSAREIFSRTRRTPFINPGKIIERNIFLKYVCRALVSIARIVLGLCRVLPRIMKIIYSPIKVAFSQHRTM